MQAAIPDRQHYADMPTVDKYETHRSSKLREPAIQILKMRGRASTCKCLVSDILET